MIEGLSERKLFNRIFLFEFGLLFLFLFLLNIATMSGVEDFAVWFQVYVMLSSLFGLAAVIVFLFRSSFFNFVPYRGGPVGDKTRGKFE